MNINKTELVYTLQRIFHQQAPVRTYPKGAVGKVGTPFYSPRPGWLRDTAFLLQSDALVLDEKLVGYITYANKTSRKKGYIQKIDREFLKEMINRGARVERI